MTAYNPWFEKIVKKKKMPPLLRLTSLDYTVLPMREQPKKRFNCTITLSLAQQFAMALAILGFITVAVIVFFIYS
ncbi:unnamed protein product [Caenorhabditis nigoni]